MYVCSTHFSADKMATSIDIILQVIANCITTQTYREVENERLELKNLAGGWGDDWHKSICAFLNTNGGVIIIGINDKNNAKPPHYKFTGYTNSTDNENYLKQVLPKKFTDKDGLSIDVSSCLSRIEIRDFLDGNIALLYVDELADDKKYAHYEGKAYFRKLTGDHELSRAEIEEYEELKAEVITHQELEIVKNATLDVLNIDKLNEYILKFNRGKKSGETLKADLEAALPFLHRKSFVREKQPTLLGMLVCGDYVEDYIQGKCEVDCYVASPIKVASDKKPFKDNVITLIEDSFSFIYRSIQVGVGYANSGTAEPEYPEDLIRESINNAIAHRSYRSERFVIIEIKPNERLMIQNPGAFGRRQRLHFDSEFGKVRRIVPIQVARNPKLADLLKSFDRWEGIGKGLSSLIDACLENLIDVPSYILTDGEIKLFIPKGKVYDAEMEIWLNSFAGYTRTKYGKELGEDEKIMLSFYRKSELLNRLEQYTILLTMDNNHKEVIANLEDKGLIFKDPQSPEIYPIYRVDRTLMKTDFGEELRAIFKKDYDYLKEDAKEILNVIYWNNNYAHQNKPVTANGTGKVIFVNKNKQIIDLSKFETFQRKVRMIFNKLEENKMIIRKDGKTKSEGGNQDFEINANFTSTELFK
ncbi:MAG: hypothetical protein EAZ32_12490 [Cytophagia bacterium]|nr:MAG: hypothetical protein EAZ38_13125 [Cytophagales bacterium]TAG38452.1 MAG: hypothetical protein EAZ32_12490 [Cytophagia bacterium]TAG80031.1 MAG: hypothetical protein EAZ22_10430 [Cytophagales bacterium]